MVEPKYFDTKMETGRIIGMQRRVRVGSCAMWICDGLYNLKGMG